MPLVPAFGTSMQNSDVALMLQDQLAGMGDFLTTDVGTLNWIEAYVNARTLATALQFIKLMANELSPNSASIFLQRWAQIYNTLGLADADAIQKYIEDKQAEFGTPPTLTNIETFLNERLGSSFIEIQWPSELQPLATTDPHAQITLGGKSYESPLSNVLIYVWQPRDNQDNLLVPTSIFAEKVESYHQILQDWNPPHFTFITMNLTNRGFQDGYGNNYNGLNYNNYLDGYNVVSATAGSTTIIGTDTAFFQYPDGSVGDFQGAVSQGFFPPIQVVDDMNTLQTYYVSAVADNTHLTVTQPIVNNITNRTYRTIGFVLDTDGILDFGGLFNV